SRALTSSVPSTPATRAAPALRSAKRTLEPLVILLDSDGAAEPRRLTRRRGQQRSSTGLRARCSIVQALRALCNFCRIKLPNDPSRQKMESATPRNVAGVRPWHQDRKSG